MGKVSRDVQFQRARKLQMDSFDICEEREQVDQEDLSSFCYMLSKNCCVSIHNRSQ